MARRNRCQPDGIHQRLWRVLTTLKQQEFKNNPQPFDLIMREYDVDPQDPLIMETVIVAFQRATGIMHYDLAAYSEDHRIPLSQQLQVLGPAFRAISAHMVAVKNNDRQKHLSPRGTARPMFERFSWVFCLMAYPNTRRIMSAGMSGHAGRPP